MIGSYWIYIILYNTLSSTLTYDSLTYVGHGIDYCHVQVPGRQRMALILDLVRRVMRVTEGDQMP